MKENIETKQDLLSAMAELKACKGATAWVLEQEGTTHDIWLRCQELDWLIWFAGRRNPKEISDFTYRCAERAKAYAYTADADAARAADAARTANNAFYAARAAADAARTADAAFYATAAADAATDAARAARATERKLQLDDLHEMWELIK